MQIFSPQTNRVRMMFAGSSLYIFWFLLSSVQVVALCIDFSFGIVFTVLNLTWVGYYHVIVMSSVENSNPSASAQTYAVAL